VGGNISTLVTRIPKPENFKVLEQALGIERARELYRMLNVSLTKVGAHNQVEAPDVFGAKPPYLPLSLRRDVLVFQTRPLDDDVEVTGPLRVELWASSSAVDTDFTAKLIDVHPPNENYVNGYAMNLSDSIMRARYRDSFERPKLMELGVIYKFTVQPYPTSNLFKKGHRIRLDVSSSNWPRFDINPNTGEPLGLSNRTESAVNTIYHEAAHPSLLVLPIIPKENPR
jgi:hypothetical protein